MLSLGVVFVFAIFRTMLASNYVTVSNAVMSIGPMPKFSRLQIKS